MSAAQGVEKKATISECGRYRYDLWRTWGVGPHVTFIMLNPSTADHEQDDPTIRKCIKFAKQWGFSGLVVVNLFAYRATDPKDLWKAEDPIGPLNDLYIESHAFCGVTVAGWGAKPKVKARADEVCGRLKNLRTIRLTKDGYPEHPLFLPSDLQPFPWNPQAT